MKKRIKIKKLKGTKKMCSKCEGHGQYENSYDDMYGNNYSMGWFVCENCDGEGFVNGAKDFKAEVKSNKFINKLFGGNLK